MTEPPSLTADGRYVLIKGRRWRATDPLIPAQRRDELQRTLMAWRREVGRQQGTDAEDRARQGVHAAKVALGERGTPWWEQSTAQRRRRWETAVPRPS